MSRLECVCRAQRLEDDFGTIHWLERRVVRNTAMILEYWYCGNLLFGQFVRYVQKNNKKRSELCKYHVSKRSLNR